MAQKDTILTILSGQTESAELTLHGAGGRRALTINIISPAILPETVHPHLGNAVSGTYGLLQSGGSDVLLAAGKATILDSIVAVTLKLVATGVTADDRAFIVMSANRAYE